MSWFERMILNLLPPGVRLVVEAIYATALSLQPGQTVPLPAAFWTIKGIRLRQDTQITRLPNVGELGGHH